MSKHLKDLIADIIWENAKIRVEYGEDPYVDNTEELADIILSVLEEKL